jgi:haloalkane dehalogenase
MSPQTTANGISFLRTPDERFDLLVDFPFEPNYIDIDGLRMAYIDEGPRDGSVILCLHGEPSWSYLYRFMIPKLVPAGYRVVAPDLIGFGRSDKPTERSSYSYLGHVSWMTTFISALGISNITLFCQDWGGLIGLRIVGDHPDWFARLVIANTALPDSANMGDGFKMWQAASQAMPFMDCGALLKRAVLARELTEAEMDCYRAPFPDESFMAGARQFPMLVPTTADDPALPANQSAWKVLESFTKPVLTLWAPDDVVLGKGQAAFIERIPGTAGQPHQTFSPAGHFLQDDVGPALADAIIGWIPFARSSS